MERGGGKSPIISNKRDTISQHPQSSKKKNERNKLVKYILQWQWTFAKCNQNAIHGMSGWFRAKGRKIFFCFLFFLLFCRKIWPFIWKWFFLSVHFYFFIFLRILGLEWKKNFFYIFFCGKRVSGTVVFWSRVEKCIVPYIEYIFLHNIVV